MRGMVLDQLGTVGEDLAEALETAENKETKYHIRSAAQRLVVVEGELEDSDC